MSESEDMELEARVRETISLLMTRTGMTTYELADRLDTTQSTISRKVSGRGGKIHVNDLPRFAEVFGVTASELIQGYAWLSQNRRLPPGRDQEGQTRL